MAKTAKPGGRRPRKRERSKRNSACIPVEPDEAPAKKWRPAGYIERTESVECAYVGTFQERQRFEILWLWDAIETACVEGNLRSRLENAFELVLGVCAKLFWLPILRS